MYEVVDQFTGMPSIEVVRKIHWNIEVGNGYNWFYAVFEAFVYDCIIESESFFIYLLYAIRNDS